MIPKPSTEDPWQAFLQKPPTDGAALRSFAAISPTRYRHERDRSAHDLVSANGGLDELVHIFSKHFQERALRVENLANCVRLSPRQLPGLYAICEEVCERLGVHQPIEFFLGQGFNAWTSGVDEPYVVLGHELLSVGPNPAYVRFIIGHELGHVLSEHVHYHQIARWAMSASQAIPLVGSLLRSGLDLALYDWYRTAEFTADRAGFLACQNFQSASHLLMVFAGYPPALTRYFNFNACVEQDEIFREESSRMVSKLLRFQSEKHLDHPWPIVRVAELSRWIETGDYQQLVEEVSEEVTVNGNPFKEAAAPAPCPVCHAPVVGRDRFCSACGAPVARTKGAK